MSKETIPTEIMKWRQDVLRHDYFYEVWNKCDGSQHDFERIIRNDNEKYRIEHQNIYRGRKTQTLKLL